MISIDVIRLAFTQRKKRRREIHKVSNLVSHRRSERTLSIELQPILLWSARLNQRIPRSNLLRRSRSNRLGMLLILRTLQNTSNHKCLRNRAWGCLNCSSPAAVLAAVKMTQLRRITPMKRTEQITKMQRSPSEEAHCKRQRGQSLSLAKRLQELCFLLKMRPCLRSLKTYHRTCKNYLIAWLCLGTYSLTRKSLIKSFKQALRTKNLSLRMSTDCLKIN